MKRQAILVVSGIVISFAGGLAVAGPGHDHDHGDEGMPSVTTNAPRRLPDGSVFLPKLSQRQIAVRTIITEQKDQPQAFELMGKVIMDPNAGGKVQSMVAGRIEPGPRGLPSLGQPVRQGEILAFVRPATGTLERANQAAQAAEIKSAKALAEKRLARLQQLEGSVPKKEIDAARIELQSARERLAAVGASLSAREPLRAPVSGVIATASAVAGQVIDAKEVLYEIVDPSRLRVEAVAHDATLATAIASATALTNSGQALNLEYIGAGRTLREQAVPVQFRIRAAKGSQTPALSVGQPVKVVAQSKALVPGVAVPAGAIVKNASNQDIVWVHTGAERFEQRPVRQHPLNGTTVMVTSGLKGGERIVVQGAPLVNQVR